MSETSETPSKPAPAANVMHAQHAVLRATVRVTRKATGLVETYQIVGTPIGAPDEPKKEHE